MFKHRNIKTYIKVKKDVKDFLLSPKNREFFVFLFFFIVAGGFWLLQTLNNDYETEFAVPVRIKGIPDDVVVTSDPTSEIHVKVKDKGTVLLKYMLGRSFFPVNIDFVDYQGKDYVVHIPSSLYEKKVSAQLNASTVLLSIKPDTLEYIYAKGAAKQLPVKLRGTVSAELQYYLSDTVFRPDSVLAYAPEGELDTVTAIYTQLLELKNITDTVVRQVSLQCGKGVKLAPSVVEMVLPVDVYTEKTVEVPLTGVGFPSGKVLRAFPSKVQITFQIGMSRFRQVDAGDFSIQISYADLLRLGTDKYTVYPTRIPENVSHVRCNPAQVDFLIEQLSSDYGY